MDTCTLTSFFMVCTIINGALLGFWTIIFLLFPDLVFKTQSKWFSFSRQTFDIIFYSFLGVFKIIFIMFNLVPWLALLIVG